MANLIARMPLVEGNGAGYRYQNLSVSVEAFPMVGLVRLQGPESDPIFCEGVGQAVIKLSPPGKTTVRDKYRCHWVAPGEWVIAVGYGEEPAILDRLQCLTDGRAALASVITDGRSVLRVSGASARSLFSNGCALDLHPEKFRLGDSTITRLMGIAAMVTRIEESVYEVIVDRAYARFAWDRLVDAAREYDAVPAAS